MKAGREMDAKIAEKVFGLTARYIETDEEERRWNGDDWFMGSADLIEEIEQYRGIGGYGEYNIPHYSTDISAAWLVWKKSAALRSHKMMTFWAALRSLVALRIDYDYRITDAMVALHMEPEDICKAMLEAHGMRMLPDWYYEDPAS